LYLGSATMLGKRTAELHLMLGESTHAAFAPEPFDAAALHALADAMRQHGETVLDRLQQRAGSLKDLSRAHADAVLAARAALLDHFDVIRGVTAAGLRIRVHGDYHLGQVLRTEEDFVILDFEGEPARSLAERRAKQSPLKDVAGMVRSFGYAAYAALLAFTVHAPDTYALLEPWANTWRHWASESFLGGYRAMIGDSPLVPHGEAFRTLLRAFVLDKALYELGYELNNRPDWIRIPLAGVLGLVAPTSP
jgi:maltose alpha-D-glucosyltransferase/alpha-amylase